MLNLDQTGRTGLYSFLSIFLLIGLINVSASHASLYKKIDEVKLQKAKLSQTWLLDQEIVGNPKALDKFHFIYQKRAKEIINQGFLVKKKIIQINYCLFDNRQDAELTALKMRLIAQNLNIIFEKKNVVIEILSEDSFLKQEAFIKLGAAPIIKEKLLNRDQVPDTWSLSHIILVEKSKLPFFSNKLGGSVSNIINQVFMAGKDRVKINYVSAATPSDTKKILSVMEKNNSVKTKIQENQGVIVEVITSDQLLMQTALELFN